MPSYAIYINSFKVPLPRSASGPHLLLLCQKSGNAQPMDNSSVKYLRTEFIFLLSSAKEPPLPFKTWFIHVHKPIQLQIFTLNSIYVDHQPTYLGGPPCMDVLCFPSCLVITCDHAGAIHGQVAQGAFVVAGTKIQNALVEFDRFLEAVLQWIPTQILKGCVMMCLKIGAWKKWPLNRDNMG